MSYVDNVSEIVVSWITQNNTQISVVEYGIGGLVKRATAIPQRFVDGGKDHTVRYTHNVKLSNLLPKQTYGKFCIPQEQKVDIHNLIDRIELLQLFRAACETF